ncbi:N-acetyllactosamine synthase [Aureococcus anophagefferens]|nr:N-acetyllactosamine synthase [Aureococcus anophagefferens]
MVTMNDSANSATGFAWRRLGSRTLSKRTTTDPPPPPSRPSSRSSTRCTKLLRAASPSWRRRAPEPAPAPPPRQIVFDDDRSAAAVAELQKELDEAHRFAGLFAKLAERRGEVDEDREIPAPSTNASHRLAIVVPFREDGGGDPLAQGIGRDRNLRNFTAYMCDFVKVPFDIVVPENPENNYAWKEKPTLLLSATSQWDYKGHNSQLVGGALQISHAQYAEVGGYSNKFEGWGAEDENMGYRLTVGGAKSWNGLFGKLGKKIGRYTALDHQRVMGLDETEQFGRNMGNMHDLSSGLDDVDFTSEAAAQLEFVDDEIRGPRVKQDRDEIRADEIRAFLAYARSKRRCAWDRSKNRCVSNTSIRRALVPFDIVVVEQSPHGTWNKGKLFNVGFHLTNGSHDYMVLHDVDQIPENPENNYAWKEKPTLLLSTTSQWDYKEHNMMLGVGGVKSWSGGTGKLGKKIGRYTALDHQRVMGLDETEQFGRNMGNMHDLSSGLDDVDFTYAVEKWTNTSCGDAACERITDEERSRAALRLDPARHQH